MKGADDRTADGASDGALDETKGDEPVVPVAAAVAAGYDAALENLGRVMDTETPPPPPGGDQVAVLSHRIAQGTSLAAQKRDEFAQLQAQIADAIGEDEARALFTTIAEDPSGFLADKRRLVREAAQARQAANNAEADAAQAKQLLDDIHLTANAEAEAAHAKQVLNDIHPELKELMVRELRKEMEKDMNEMNMRLQKMEALMDEVVNVLALCHYTKKTTGITVRDQRGRGGPPFETFASSLVDARPGFNEGITRLKVLAHADMLAHADVV